MPRPEEVPDKLTTGRIPEVRKIIGQYRRKAFHQVLEEFPELRKQHRKAQRIERLARYRGVDGLELLN
jgi:hypothetical protein